MKSAPPAMAAVCAASVPAIANALFSAGMGRILTLPLTLEQV